MKLAVAIVLLPSLGSLAKAADAIPKELVGDWPESGGTPAKNMVSTASGIPIDFDPGKKKAGGDEVDIATRKRCAWAAKIGAQGFRAPTIAGGKVLISTNNGAPRDKKHDGDRGVVMCFDEKSGKFLWQLVVPKLGGGPVPNLNSYGIRSSALIHNNRAYLITNRCQVACLDMGGLADGNAGPFQGEATYGAMRFQQPLKLAGTDADIIWLYDMRTELGVFPHDIASSSPTLVDGKLLVTTSNSVDWSHINIPAKEAPCLIALDPDTGELLGEEQAGISKRTLHSNWSSPATATIDGKPTIFYGGGDGFAYSFNPKAVKNADAFLVFPENWRIDCNPPEYRVDENGKKRKYGRAEGPGEIIGTPVFYYGHVYVAIGQDPDHREGGGMLSCIDARTGKRVWESREVESSVSTASIADGLLYIADCRGRVHCFDAKSGEKHWSFDTASQIRGSTLVVDGKVLVGNEEGELIILATGKILKKIGQIDFDSAIYATPVVANGRLYITTQTHLYTFEN